MEKSSIVVISGASGSGKGTVVKKLIKKDDRFHVSVSVTSRDPRDDDIPDVTYHFVTPEKFKDMIANDELAEHAIYADKYYGTPRYEIEDTLKAGKSVILEIDTHGALQIKKMYPDATLIWITPPDYDNLEKRLRERDNNTESDIIKRLTASKNELQLLDYYDYIIINRDGEADKAAEQIRKILEVKALAVSSNKDFRAEFYKKNI